jgi:hypothetical protein
VPGGDVIASIADFGGGALFLDVRGTAFVGVEDPGFLGAVVLTTPGGAPTFGNATLNAINFPAITESANVVFDLTSPEFALPSLFLTASVTPAGPITDPALAALVGAGSLRFEFTFMDSTDLGGATLSRFGLTGIESVPEPASAAMFAGGALAILVVRRLRA